MLNIITRLFTIRKSKKIIRDTQRLFVMNANKISKTARQSDNMYI